MISDGNNDNKDFAAAGVGGADGNAHAYIATDVKTGQPLRQPDSGGAAAIGGGGSGGGVATTSGVDDSRVDGDAGDGLLHQQQPQARQGHLCCGHFSDMRRAVIVANVINIILALFEILIPNKYLWTYDSDFVDKQSAGQTMNASFGQSILLSLPRILLSGIGIYGAINFTYWQIFIVALWHTTDCGISLLLWDVPGIITGILYTYPHVVFAQQLSKGIMTKDTYYTREQSACCCGV